MEWTKKLVSPETPEEMQLRDLLFSRWKRQQRFFSSEGVVVNVDGETFDNREGREVTVNWDHYAANGLLLEKFNPNETLSLAERRTWIVTEFETLQGLDLPAHGVLASDLKGIVMDSSLRLTELRQLRLVCLQSLCDLDTQSDPRCEWAVQEWQKLLRWVVSLMPRPTQNLKQRPKSA